MTSLYPAAPSFRRLSPTSGERDKRVLSAVLKGALATALLAGAFSAMAQTPDLLPQRGIYPNGSYSFDKLEAINKQNGILTYGIPVTSLPLGRAGMTVPVTLTYSSALSDAYLSAGYQQGQPVTYGVASGSAYGGWRFAGYGYSLYTVDTPVPNCATATIPPFQLYVIMPDGAHHILKLYNQPDPYSNGGYWFNPLTGTNPCTGAAAPNPLVYYTTDGSYLRVVVDNSNPSGGSYTIFLPNGTTVSGSWNSGSKTIQDRNGNRVTISTSDSGSTTTLADDEGRTITLTSTTVTQTGADGNTLTWTLGGYQNFPVTVGCDNPAPTGCGGYSGGGPTFFQVPSDSGPLQYTFGYDSSTGELSRVTLPSGATTTYTYTTTPPTIAGITSLRENYGVDTKTVTWTDHADGGSTPRSEPWHYNYSSIWIGGSCQGYCTNIVAPDGGTATTTFIGTGALKGMVTKETMPDGSGTEYLNQQNPAYLEMAGSADSANPFVRLAAHTVAHGGAPTLAAVEGRMIDQNGNLTEDTGYDFVSYSQLQHDSNGNLSGFGGGLLLRDVIGSYNVFTPNATNGAGPPDNANAYWNPSAAKLRGLITRSVTTGSGSGAAAEFSYDSNGNTLQERRWDSSKVAGLPASLDATNSSVTGRTYDGYGNVTKVTDARQVVTQFTYDSSQLYPTAQTEAFGTSQALVTRYGWDVASGVLLSRTDSNNVTTAYGYDALGRQKMMIEGSGTSIARQTQTIYDDQNRRVIVKRDLNGGGDGRW